jgi:hypothetical protein
MEMVVDRRHFRNEHEDRMATYNEKIPASA